MTFKVSMSNVKAVLGENLFRRNLAPKWR